MVDVSKVECCHCGRLVDRLDTKRYTIESTGERFTLCRKCYKQEGSIF